MIVSQNDYGCKADDSDGEGKADDSDGEGKNRPVATNFQFLKILAPLGQLLVGACLPQTLLGTSTANWNLSGRDPSILLPQDRSVT